MSTTVSTPPRRRVRTIIWWAVFLLIAASLLAFFGGREATTYDALDPANNRAQGARAVAQVLRAEGVEVTEVRSADALEAQRVDISTTVVVTSTDNLGPSTIGRLLDHARPGGLLVVEPGPAIASQLGVGDPYSVEVFEPRAGDCLDSRFDNLTLDVDFGAEYDLLDGCFGGDEGVLLGTNRVGTTVLGAGQLLQNDAILRGDNAAIALRALGEAERVVWYVPTVADLDGDDAVGLTTLLPEWLRPALLLVGTAVLGLILWRGRRLGALVSEPTPVHVKAIESTLARGRLYRKANDRAHAAAALRSATRETLRQRLHLPPRTTPDVLSRAVADHLHVSGSEVDELIAPHAPTPPTDQHLIALADQLADIEEKVRRS